jgi:hypothetical protein
VWRELHDHPEASRRHPHQIAQILEGWASELTDARWCEKIGLVIRNADGKILTVRHRNGKGAERTLDLPYAVTRPRESAIEAVQRMAALALGIEFQPIGEPTMSSDRVHAYWFDELPEGMELNRDHRWVEPEQLFAHRLY